MLGEARILIGSAVRAALVHVTKNPQKRPYLPPVLTLNVAFNFAWIPFGFAPGSLCDDVAPISKTNSFARLAQSEGQFRPKRAWSRR